MLHGNMGPSVADGSDCKASLDRYARLAQGAFAANTVRALESDSRLFAVFCVRHGLDPLPAAPSTVVLWLEASARAGHTVATVRRRLSSLAHLHRAAGVADPTRDQAVRLALRRYVRTRGGRPRQAAPLNQAAVAAILATTRGAALRDLRDLALPLVLRDLLGRRGEACALDVADITPEPDGSATVLIRRSKTDQAGSGTVVWLSPQAHAALRNFWSTAGITTGPAFRALRKGGRLGGRLQEGDVARRLKAMAARAGIDATNVSGHSCRIGMAQDLTASGFGLPEIMQAGRWKSPAMVARAAAPGSPPDAGANLTLNFPGVDPHRRGRPLARKP